MCFSVFPIFIANQGVADKAFDKVSDFAVIHIPKPSVLQSTQIYFVGIKQVWIFLADELAQLADFSSTDVANSNAAMMQEMKFVIFGKYIIIHDKLQGVMLLCAFLRSDNQCGMGAVARGVARKADRDEFDSAMIPHNQ